METELHIPSCPRHNIPKFKRPGGSLICKQCDKERARERAVKRISSGETPSPCPKCEGIREWDTFGRPKCSSCRSAETKAWRETNEEKALEGRRRYYIENREAVLEHNRNYIANNYEKVKQTRRAYQSQFDREYWMWKTMNARCYTPTNSSFKNYGGRGISVYELWRIDPALSSESNYEKYLAFKKYLDDNLGVQPTDSHSLDRKDNNGNYEPGNLKWSSRKEQANNQRRNISNKLSVPDNSPIDYPCGNIITIREFSDMVGIPLSVCKYRYAQHPGNSEWIINDHYGERYYNYKGHRYTMTELSLLSGIAYHTLSYRINKQNWDIDKALEIQ